ncbi:hypothetical protein ACPWSR_18145 [Alloiococcus sp. CFN-8]|uniref:hypothetical protein n=1 Tax=Alloiococcus sp. CFN-8 TaxID=3416081 RepID=UPI003CF0C12D
MKNVGVYLKDKPEYEDYSENIMARPSCCGANKNSKGCGCSGNGKGCCQRLELKNK